MFIMKFHKLIGSRIFWIIFSILICAAFIMMDAMSTNINRNAKSPAREIGKLNGKSVAYTDFVAAKRMASRENNDLPNVPVWKQLALTQQADLLGIEVSEEEIHAQVREIPAFHDEQGRFSSARFDQIWKDRPHEALAFRFSLKTGLRDAKIEEALSACVWVAPSQINEQVSIITDMLTVNYAIMGTNMIDRTITSPEDVTRAFFEENANYFMTEPERQVRYVSFAAGDTTDLPVPDAAAIEAYYNSNSSDYVRGESTNIALIPLEEVRDEIVSVLKQDAALAAAKGTAVEYATQLLNTDNAAELFEKIATDNKLEVKTSDFFNEYDESGLDPAFVEAAFALTPGDPDRAYSLAIQGSNAVYVMAYVAEKEARIPEFEEVRDDVQPHADEKAQIDHLVENAGAYIEKLKTAMASGTAFTNATAALELEGAVAGPLSINDLPPALANPVLLRDLISCETGGFAEPTLSYQGVIIAQLAQRQPDVAAAAGIRTRISETLTRMASSQLFEDWQGYLVSDERLKISDDEETLAPGWTGRNSEDESVDEEEG